MYREWGPRAKPIWNPLKNARKVDSLERKVRGLDEHCHVCNKKGHPWRECPLLRVKKKGTGKTQFTRKINEADLKYCTRCFQTGHEQEECPKKQDEKSAPIMRTQRERDIAKFIHAKHKEFNVLSDEPEERKKFTFKKKKLKSDENLKINEKNNHAKRSASLKTSENEDIDEPPKKKQKVVAYDTSESQPSNSTNSDSPKLENNISEEIIEKNVQKIEDDEKKKDAHNEAVLAAQRNSTLISALGGYGSSSSSSSSEEESDT